MISFGFINERSALLVVQIILLIILLKAAHVFDFEWEQFARHIASGHATLLHSQEADNSGSLLNKVLFPSLFFISLVCFIIFYRKSSTKISAMPILFLALLTFAFLLSMFSSEYPDVTLRRSISQLIYISTLFICVFVIRQQSVLYSYVYYSIVIVIALDLLVSLSGFESISPFVGMHGNENVAGILYAFFSIFLAAKIHSGGRKKNSNHFLFAIAVLLLALSTSRTAILVALLFIPFDFLSGKMKLRSFAYISMLLICIASSLYFLFQVKDATVFTHRGEIWLELRNTVIQNPLLGSGYLSHFDVGDNENNTMTNSTGEWSVNTAHNGYIEIILGLGFIWFIFLMLLFAVIIWKISKLPTRAYLVRFVVFMLLISNTMETNFLYYQNYIWTISVLVITTALLSVKKHPKIPVRKSRKKSIKKQASKSRPITSPDIEL